MIRRKIKNVVKNYTDVEILVRETTSNESWGPSNSMLVKVAVLSSLETNLIQIMPIIWKRLKDTGKKWRHVYKSLILLEFLITRGNPAVADNCRQNIHFLETLKDFKYDENNVDVGSRIRKRTDTVVELLKDESLLKIERNKAAITDMRFSKAIISQGSNVPIKYGNGVGSLSQGASTGSFGSSTEIIDYSKEYVVPSSLLEEDMQLQIALAESQEDANRKKMLDEIENLTDNYKLSIAMQKNLQDNEVNNDVASELKQKSDQWPSDANQNISTNDPWTSMDPIGSPIGVPVVSNPWSNIDASNDSLWSDSLSKPDSADPWTTDCLSNPTPDNPWVTPELSDPWRDNNKLSTSISQCAISTANERNPWTAHIAASNPIPRKFIGRNKDESVTNFLANHSHLVDFDNLISVDSLKSSNQENSNPFLIDHQSPCNPFLSSNNAPSNFYPQLVCTSSEAIHNPEPIQTGHKPNKNLNPFLV